MTSEMSRQMRDNRCKCRSDKNATIGTAIVAMHTESITIRGEAMPLLLFLPCTKEKDSNATSIAFTPMAIR